ncbi:ATP-binding protein [Clostridium guangxiense]|uniref:ATP-binding protein n=1 Tax=Clostridium guangxiense TaxID=1662055 RepID=UPI001E2DC7C9|nr:ATP-binding protein [Clostridium guangxiense]MCD2345863.1 ATP-binding protein [Clostridium guangxiense]
MKKVSIGKYTLESLTMGMYADPYVLYREYIQNAADSIDKAVKYGVLKRQQGKIQVSLIKDINEIEIIDNGLGISKEKVYNTLLDIGNSEKKINEYKGFRGIGRLSGLGYCEKIIFETSAIGESVKSVVCIDSIKLQKYLLPGEYENLTLEDVIIKSSDLKFEEEDEKKHFFKVKLVNVKPKLKLLDFDRVLEYLEETSPVPYNNEMFRFGTCINGKLNELGVKIDEYNLYLCNGDVSTKVYKPYRTKFFVDLKKQILDEITDVNIKIIKNDFKDSKLVAIVWYGKSKLFGTIMDNKLKGLRIRKSGLLIGDRFLANSIFKEERFNGWIIGEIIIVDNNIIPNARRDGFEKNDAYLFLVKKLRIIGEKISDEIRFASKMRSYNQKKNTIKMANKNKLGSSNNIAILKKIDNLVSQINHNDKLLIKLKKVLGDNNIAPDIIEKVLADMKGKEN